MTAETNAPLIVPVVVNEKSLVSTPVTSSLKVTVKFKVVALVGLGSTRALDTTVGFIVSTATTSESVALSTVAETVAGPLAVPAVKVAVATPFVSVVIIGEMVPLVVAKLTGIPFGTKPPVGVAPFEFFVKSAVTVEVPPPPTVAVMRQPHVVPPCAHGGPAGPP